eukprot:gnl/TRDRNA2_/TRDRNA2_185021_c0_seq1.p1 gnl/TRDRNA2_/TRDRNA2_185021_c0~~gnl/TRDRNA2_/TRDRNA2_185021_c0_seq1.p1  ORF type:complete len:281 (+),score=62.08 gnl/TRDRNA2_/TRDRNA2_185021_c0_seq1:73-915(+)
MLAFRILLAAAVATAIATAHRELPRKEAAKQLAAASNASVTAPLHLTSQGKAALQELLHDLMGINSLVSGQMQESQAQKQKPKMSPINIYRAQMCTKRPKPEEHAACQDFMTHQCEIETTGVGYCAEFFGVNPPPAAPLHAAASTDVAAGIGAAPSPSVKFVPALVPQEPSDVFIARCTSHVYQVVHTIDMFYTDVQVETVLSNECRLAEDFPYAHDDGFHNFEACIKFAKKLTAVRRKELNTGVGDYSPFCTDYWNHAHTGKHFFLAVKSSLRGIQEKF